MIFSKGLKNKLEIIKINEPSMFEPLKVYCICKFNTVSDNIGFRAAQGNSLATYI